MHIGGGVSGAGAGAVIGGALAGAGFSAGAMKKSFKLLGLVIKRANGVQGKHAVLKKA